MVSNIRDFPLCRLALLVSTTRNCFPTSRCEVGYRAARRIMGFVEIADGKGIVMALEDRFDELPDELKEKAKACTSVEEVVQLAKESLVEVSDEEIEAIAGGSWSGGGGGCGSDDCREYRFS